MRTNIIVNDQLMKEAMRLSGLLTKKAVVEESLKLFVAMQKQKELSVWFKKNKSKQKDKAREPYSDPLLALAGALSDEDADWMMRIIYEDRSAKWDAHS